MNKIEKNRYQGYLWMSDEQRPRVLADELLELDLNDNEVPFITTGLLWCEEKRTSICISYMDGKYRVCSIPVDEIPKDRLTTERYLPSKRLAVEMSKKGMGERMLSFQRQWTVYNDPLCEDLETLEPEALLFVGFEINKETER